MDYQILPTISKGNFKEIIKDEKLYGNIIVLTTAGINKLHKLDSYCSQNQYALISDVEPELPFSYIESCYKRLPQRIDIIIAIGGGSVIDLAKVIAVAPSFFVLKKHFYNSNLELQKRAKVIAVPTTFGTGAEMSFGSILYDDELNKKGGLRSALIQPDEVIIDTVLYKTAPSKLMAESGFDCLTHAIETYFSKASNAIVKFQSVACIKIVFAHLVKAVKVTDDLSVEKMAISSMLMGINLAFSSTCMPHRIQYIIGPLTKTSHAQGLVVLYNGWLKLISEYHRESKPVKDLLFDLSMTFDEFWDTLKSLKKTLNINYELSDYGIVESDIESIVSQVEGNLQNDPFYVDLSSIHFILKESL